MSYDTLQNGLSLIVDSEKVDFVDIDQSYQVRVTCVHALSSDGIPRFWCSDDKLGFCDLLPCELVVSSKFANYDTERAQAI